MKISRTIIQGLVVIAIIISFVLSFLIWTNNSRYQMQSNTDIAKNKVNIQNVVTKREVYSPSQILWNDGKDIKMVYNNKHNIVSAFQKDMGKWRFTRVKTQSKNDVAKYKEFINNKDSVQLLYPLQMSLSYYGQMLNKNSLKRNDKTMFNRVLFYLDKDDKNIYLGNDETHTIYRVSVNSGDSTNIRKLLAKTDVSLRVGLEVKNKRVDVNYLDRVSLRPYSYLVSKQEDNGYISSLLGSNDISTRRSGDTTTYSASAYQRLVSDKNKGTLAYYDYSKEHFPKSKTEVLNKGVDIINQINNPLSNAKLSHVDWKNRVLVYREYVEGFPTFEKSDFGAVKITFNKSEQVTQFSNSVIQVPVPSDQKPITLKSTAEIMNDLKTHGYDTNKISYIDLGYKWEKDDDNDDIVDLIPSYFIRIGNTWSSLEELIGVSDKVGGK
ncbi:YycH family regulatory protein [Companilactobacillus sp. DQM5]|uniref:YycH family regulatory protein n=1 Tax=Companilactobacillus sp. DQM5 TaxID=3463359 RepID=UPI00405886AB